MNQEYDNFNKEVDTVAPLQEEQESLDSINTAEEVLGSSRNKMIMYIVGVSMVVGLVLGVTVATSFLNKSGKDIPTGEGGQEVVIQGNTMSQDDVLDALSSNPTERSASTTQTQHVEQSNTGVVDKDEQQRIQADCVKVLQQANASLAEVKEKVDSEGQYSDDAICLAILFASYGDDFMADECIAIEDHEKYTLCQMNAFTQQYDVTDPDTMTQVYEIILGSLEDARNRASVAWVRSVVNSTLPSAMLCLDEYGAQLTEPRSDAPVCSGSDFVSETWPNLEEHGGSWGGCESYSDSIKYEFQYCATFPDGTIKQCTESGCVVLE